MTIKDQYEIVPQPALGPTFQGNCRSCGALLRTADVLCDLGTMPLANKLLTYDQLVHAEICYPLRPLVCRNCLLVQLPNTPADSEVFTDAYPFFSGQSEGWRQHCQALVCRLTYRQRLNSESHVLEIGSNDGTLLSYFTDRGVRVLGVEPCRGVAEHALHNGIATDIAFWGEAYAKEMVLDGYRADLVVATNVLAHVTDLRDFLRGVRRVLAPKGVAVFEVPYVGCLISDRQFDQIYAEHHCYFSIRSLQVALEAAGLQICATEAIPTHGGSIRVTAKVASSKITVTQKPAIELWAKDDAELRELETYLAFQSVPARAKREAWALLTDTAHYHGIEVRIAGYGASAKACVTLNYFGMGPETIAMVADTTPTKQGKYLPGVRTPIVSSARLAEYAPDIVINFLWNWREESERNIREVCPNATILYFGGNNEKV